MSNRIEVRPIELGAWEVVDTKTGKCMGLYAEWNHYDSMGAPFVTIQITLDDGMYVDRDDIGTASNMSPDEFIKGILMTLANYHDDDKELRAALLEAVKEA